MEEQKLKEILLKEHYVSEGDLARAEEYAKGHHSTIEEFLLTEGLITNDLLGQAIAESLGVPYADLNSNQPAAEQVLKIPQELAARYRVVLFKEEAGQVVVTTDNPQSEGLLTALAPIFQDKPVTLAYSLTEDIEAAFIHYRKPLQTRFSEIVKQQKLIAPTIIDEIFDDAIAFRSSDIHFEPQPKEVIVRFRVDGLLHEAGRLPKEHYENILNRIKVSAHMRIDEHFAAQDGAMRYVKRATVTDMRVSVVPTIDGEKVAIRLLGEYVRAFTLGDLGLNAVHQDELQVAARKPFGMMIVCGPTGSGKTTTLYALLKFLNRPEVNVTTIEDPVEYRLAGVNQIQVNPQTNLTFAKGLRSIVRQDPDIILVGEIRDNETAEIAVNAALTGHLLLSTFHANDASTAIPRLLDMGVEPFLLASTLELIVAQRLVRKICEGCRVSYTPTPEELAKFAAPVKKLLGRNGSGAVKLRVYRGKGCERCHGSGFKGRTAIYECISVGPKLEELMLKRPSAQEIWECARKDGVRGMFEDGVEKVRSGLTTMEELLRVAQPPA